jgi:hypothetical protein
MRRLLTAACLLVSAFCLGTSEASANIVFDLVGVTFSDGGTATGSFTANDALTTLIDFNIHTSPGSAIGFDYNTGTADGSSTSLPFILVLNNPPTLDNILQLTFANPLTPAGSPITIGTFDSFEEGPDNRRDVVAGSVVPETTAVPEPSTFVLAGLGGLALVGLALRRRRA